MCWRLIELKIWSARWATVSCAKVHFGRTSAVVVANKTPWQLLRWMDNARLESKERLPHRGQQLEVDWKLSVMVVVYYINRDGVRMVTTLRRTVIIGAWGEMERNGAKNGAPKRNETEVRKKMEILSEQRMTVMMEKTMMYIPIVGIHIMMRMLKFK